MRFPHDTVILGSLAIIAVVILGQAVLPERVRVIPPAPTVNPTPCRGEAISVPYPFLGTINEEWTCRKQCDDRKLRYILYANGKATQCEELPGCNDYGEDNNITCLPPVITPNASTKK